MKKSAIGGLPWEYILLVGSVVLFLWSVGVMQQPPPARVVVQGKPSKCEPLVLDDAPPLGSVRSIGEVGGGPTRVTGTIGGLEYEAQEGGGEAAQETISEIPTPESHWGGRPSAVDTLVLREAGPWLDAYHWDIARNVPDPGGELAGALQRYSDLGGLVSYLQDQDALPDPAYWETYFVSVLGLPELWEELDLQGWTRGWDRPEDLIRNLYSYRHEVAVEINNLTAARLLREKLQK